MSVVKDERESKTWAMQWYEEESGYVGYLFEEEGLRSKAMKWSAYG